MSKGPWKLWRRKRARPDAPLAASAGEHWRRLARAGSGQARQVRWSLAALVPVKPARPILIRGPRRVCTASPQCAPPGLGTPPLPQPSSSSSSSSSPCDARHASLPPRTHACPALPASGPGLDHGSSSYHPPQWLFDRGLSWLILALLARGLPRSPRAY